MKSFGFCPMPCSLCVSQCRFDDSAAMPGRFLLRTPYPLTTPSQPPKLCVPALQFARGLVLADRPRFFWLVLIAISAVELAFAVATA